MYSIDLTALKEHIQCLGFKQKAVAEKIGMDEHKFSRVLSGERRLAASEYINLCVAIDVPLEKFVIPPLESKKELQANCDSEEFRKCTPDDDGTRYKGPSMMNPY